MEYIVCTGESMGRPLRRSPRYSSPPNFLNRVPYTLTLLATAAGLLLAFGALGATALPSVRVVARDDASVNFALNFTQVVDHFDSLNHDTFHQRYWENQRWWKVPPPQQGQAYPIALLRINSFHWGGDWNTSTIASWAKELGAVVFDLEPRYAGKSYPLPDVTTTDLRFYSIEQNVADIVSFIKNKSELLPNNTRWIVMGELYDGAFATWVRAKPGVAFGVVAVSPYLLALEGYPGYDLAYQAAIGRTCAKIIHDLLVTVSFTLNDSYESRAAYQTQCGSSDVLPNAEFMYVVSTILLGAMDYDSINLCKTFADVKDQDNTTRLNTLADYIINYNQQNYMEFVQWDFARDTGGNMTDTGAGFRPTYYLKCTQLGQFEISSGSAYSVVPAELSVDWYLSVCQKLFNNLTAERPSTDLANANFGGRTPEGCNMAFVQSANDAYAALGPDSAVLAADQDVTGNAVIEIDCDSTQIALSLFYPPDASDPACLVTARSQVLLALKTWQTQEDTCPEPTSSSGGSGGHDDGDMALVGVFSAVGGVLLGLAVAVALFLYLGRRAIQRWKTSFFSKINEEQQAM